MVSSLTVVQNHLAFEEEKARSTQEDKAEVYVTMTAVNKLDT